jgi:hypothetical protein
MSRTTRSIAALVAFTYLAVVGCGKGPPTKAMFGSVTYGGKSVPGGQVSFVPAEGKSPWVCAAPIVDGQYRIDARGGVPLGNYRVQVDARKKTGRKVKGFNGVETMMVDEEVRLGPEKYAGQDSPLAVEVRADSDGRFDIAIPIE